MADHYSTLGISPSATHAEIKAAYRRLVLQYHPDRNTAPGATERFLAIQQAWDTLSDPECKSAYDYNRNFYNTYSSAASTSKSSAAQTPPHSDPYARQEDLYGDGEEEEEYTNTHYDPYAPQFGDRPYTPPPQNRFNPHLLRLGLMAPLVIYLFLGNQVCNSSRSYPQEETVIVNDTNVNMVVVHGDTIFVGGHGTDTLVIP